MKLSVVIPLYNKQESIERAMLSVVHQLSYEHELIIIDDGSTDRSLERAKLIADKFPSLNIHVRSQSNAGVSAARNAGTRFARGRYVCFLDADDRYEANFLSEISNLIGQFPDAAMLATRYRFIDTKQGIERDANIIGLHPNLNRQYLSDFFASATYGDLPVTSSSVCIKASVLKSLGGFPENENMGEDQSVWSQLALRYPIAYSKNICANYYIDVADSLMKQVAPKGEMPFSKRLHRQLTSGDIPQRLKTSVENYMTGHLFDLVRRNMAAGEVGNARSILADPRTRLQRKRWCYWFIRTRLGI